MPKKVLSVGQCGMDHGSISSVLDREFSAEVTAVGSAEQALQALAKGGFDLVLVNRVFDRDGASGLDLIRAIQSDPSLADTPRMLVSNFADAQAQAIAAGALPGFGKAELHSRETLERLRPLLAEGPS